MKQAAGKGPGNEAAISTAGITTATAPVGDLCGGRSSSASRANISRILPHLGFDERSVVSHFKALKKLMDPSVCEAKFCDTAFIAHAGVHGIEST